MGPASRGLLFLKLVMKNLLTALPNADFSIIDEIEGSSPTGGSFSNFGDFAAIIVNIFFWFWCSNGFNRGTLSRY